MKSIVFNGLLRRYINGLDLGKYKAEDLENNCEFMTNVIKITGDYKFYNLCSDEVKRNYKFVKFIINKFKMKIDFICEVFDYYLNNTNDTAEKDELIINISNLTKGKATNYYKYSLLSDALYTSRRVEAELIKEKYKNEYNIDKKVGMGFLHIFDIYNNNEIVLDFFAKRILNEIFYEHVYDLEKNLNKYFNSKKEYGINYNLINFISQYDSFLSSYLTLHIDILKIFTEKILKNWNKNNIERVIINNIIDETYEYMSDINSNITESEYLYFIGNELGIAEKIRDCEEISDEMFNIIMERIEYMDKNDFDFNDLIHYHNIKKIMLKFIDKPKRKIKSINN